MTEPAAPMPPNETDFTSALQDKIPTTDPSSQWRDVWHQFRKHKGALFGGGFLIFITLAVIIGPYLWTLDPQKINIRSKDWRPVWVLLWSSEARAGWAHPFGTDNLGRDIFATILAGGRVSMAVGWAAMLLALVIGTLVGVLSGYFRKLDFWLMRFTDLVLSLPILPLVLLAVTLFRQPLNSAFGSPEAGMFVLIVGVIGLTNWMPTARIVRGDILALKEREFILAARSIGTSPSCERIRSSSSSSRIGLVTCSAIRMPRDQKRPFNVDADEA